MGGWQKPVAPPHQRTWEDEVLALYRRSEDMEVAEFEELLAVAVRGERPEHPDLLRFLVPDGFRLKFP